MVSRAFGCISHFVLVLLIVYLFIYPIIAFVQPVCMLLSQHISGHSLIASSLENCLLDFMAFCG